MLKSSQDVALDGVNFSGYEVTVAVLDGLLDMTALKVSFNHDDSLIPPF